MPIRHEDHHVDVWKEYDQNVITHSAAHHLMAIDELIQKTGYARVSDVARQLNITRGSVSISLQPLKKAGLILQDENRHLRLSEMGQKLVDQVKTKRLLMQRLFSEFLCVDPVQAEIDACKMEHLLSANTARQMVSFFKFMDENPNAAAEFLHSFRGFDPACGGNPQTCSSCRTNCLVDSLTD